MWRTGLPVRSAVLKPVLWTWSEHIWALKGSLLHGWWLLGCRVSSGELMGEWVSAKPKGLLIDINTSRAPFWNDRSHFILKTLLEISGIEHSNHTCFTTTLIPSDWLEFITCSGSDYWSWKYGHDSNPLLQYCELSTWRLRHRGHKKTGTKATIPCPQTNPSLVFNFQAKPLCNHSTKNVYRHLARVEHKAPPIPESSME